MGQLFEMTIHASGEVRDAEGNLVSASPVEAKLILTEEEVRSLMQGDK